MDDLIAFLKARLDEREAVAQAATPGPWHVESTLVVAANGCTVVPPGAHYAISDEDAAHIARHDPARVLRDVAAERAIVERYVRGAGGDLPEWKAGRELIEAGLAILAGVLRDLAAICNDHPDYRPGWKP